MVDILLHFFALLISFILIMPICYYGCNCKSYFKLAFMVVTIYILLITFLYYIDKYVRTLNCINGNDNNNNNNNNDNDNNGGMNSGMNDGINDSINDGINNSMNDGMNDSMNDGINDSMNDGIRCDINTISFPNTSANTTINNSKKSINLSNVVAIDNIPNYNSQQIQATSYYISPSNANNIICKNIYNDNAINTIDNKNKHDKYISATPLDNLQPDELLIRLQYLHNATSNPINMLTYQDYKTSSDQTLIKDQSSLINANTINAITDINADATASRFAYARAYYPSLTKLQIDTYDCMDGGINTEETCFQSPTLFQKKYSILDKGINANNAMQIVNEDFITFI